MIIFSWLELPHLSSPTSVQEETAAKAGIILVSGEEIPVILDEVCILKLTSVLTIMVMQNVLEH